MRIQHTTYRKIIAVLILLSCVSSLFAQGSKIYHVTAEATDGGDGSSWAQAITLENALRQAKAGDEIWVKGYEDITGHIYKAPKGGFVLPSGVAMYGGFAGDENNKNNLPTGRHKYQMKYQTALVGDKDTNDKASQQLIIYPENTTRTDNVTHVLTLQMGVTQDNTNDGNKPTIVSGFLIAAGNASGKNTSANGRGGGIYVINNSNDNNAGSRYFRISQCNFANNYGMRGGAIYVDNSCTNQQSAISYCSIFNNVAGKRGSSENEGGGMWIDGTATVYNCNINNNTNGGIRLSNTSKIVNCSVIANTVSAADLTTDGASNSNGGGAVYNTVLWHSTALSKQDSRPAFYSCAFPEVEVTDSMANTDAYGNVRISNENHGIEPAPWFKQSAVTQGYDFSFSSNLKQLYSTAFTFEETSALLNKGKLEYYKNLVVDANLETTSTDIMGRTRYQTSTIDIGAYEYARMKPGRIRYVKPKKAGKGDGTSWDDATDDIQWAINNLAENAQGEKGEVWVAAGTYEVKERILTDASSPVSLLMKNGISVYGAFKGTEKRRSERIEESKDLKPWGWKQESIIRGAGFKGSDDAIWNNSDEAWNIQNSESYHVVWFAPLPEGEAFTDEVYLEGFTIEGGTYKGTGVTQYAPGCGAGVYINDPSARMRYCTVRFCNSGMKESGSIKPRGGGIYCKNGQTEGNLIYDCSAYQGGGIYIDEAGFITRSMVTNCSAYQGAGVYLNGDADNSEKAYYQILATSVISNNTSTRNGAVYLDGHGLVINNTIVNNYTNNTSDPADELSSNTGGVYIKKKGLLANNVIWNNSLLQHKSGTNNSASMAQIYAANPSEKTVQFYNNAISDVNAAKWTSTYQSGTISINTYYSGKGFVMGKEAPYNTVEAFDENRGVLTDMKTVNYYWETLTGSRLRNVGISYALLPSSYLYQPKIDLSGKAISSVPSAGAYMADNHDLVFEKNDTQKRLRIYFDRSRELVDGTGQSWEKSYTSSSVDEILGYLADIKAGDTIKVVIKDNTTPEDFTIEKNSGWEFEICGREGIFEPKIAYTFEETDARSCTFSIPPCVLPITVYGGYPEYSENPNPKDEDRDPIKYRTELNGNLNGSELNEGLYHLVRIEAGANITIDGYAFTHAYAAGTAYMPYGGGVLIGSMDQSSEPTTVKLKNCIFENNTATDGGAIATMPDAVNVKLELENCVINNNTSKDPHNPSPSELPSIIYLNKSQGSNNSLTLNHVSIINNEGVAPDNDLVKATSYAVGNKLNINGAWEDSECKNSMNINTLGKNGAMNFSNPTNEVGAKMSGNVYYGGYSSFRPLTSSAEAGAIINSAQESNATTTAKDITGEDRDLGGVPDLGAYEAHLPKAGKIIYVRSYNQKYESISDANNDDQDGNPNFNLLKESHTEYDGSSWDKAIIGNAMCDSTKNRTGNDFYVKQSDNTLLSTTIDNTDYSQTNGKYRSETDSYGKFWTNSGNQDKQYLSGWGSYNKITNNRDEQYISGLQYAVEKAAELNKIKKDSVVVWVGAGIYTDYKGFVIRDNVKVYGGFPYEGYPGEDDRHPLLSQYVPARKEYENLDKTKYETILQIRKESPVYFKNGDKEMWYQEGKPEDGSKYGYTKTLMNSGKTERHYVLYQPDVCLPTWSPSGDGNATRTDGNAVRYKGDKIDNIYYKDYEYAKWDGFSVRHGYIINYPGANRDGGAGVRVFRGVELENLIIVNNFNHGSRVRGGGLYMDGEKGGAIYLYLTKSDNGNLHIVNSLLANNDVTCGRYTGTQNSQGGAIYIRRANDAGSMAEGYQDAYIVNSLIVNNKAKQDGAIHVENEVASGTITPILYNTAIWGNESTDNSVLLRREHMRNCAWDELPASTASTAKDGNIKLNKENIASDGPRFTAPTTTKGYEGYTQDAKWNPQAISVLTDAGDGKKDADDTNETGRYLNWWTMHNTRLENYGYPSEYIRPVSGTYNRYVGPKDENGNVAEKPIDIGMYEFQYVFTFTDFEKVYIGTEEKGNGDGSSWDNQSTDLRGAIIAMANPSGSTTPGSTTNSKRKVFVRGGTYYSPTYSSGDAFSLIVNKADKAEYIESIELVGGCTGTKNADGTEVQDFSKPSVLIENPAKAGETKNLLNIETNGKPVTISGFTFQNQSGVGVNAKVNLSTNNEGSLLKVHNSAFRKNKKTGMVVNNNAATKDNESGIKMWNVLFADGEGNGLKITKSQSADITNATFVNNTDTAVVGTQSVYNSVAWKNGSQKLKTANRNIVIEKTIENGDVLNGPNFVDPENGDYRIRPSLKLLDQGNNEKYRQNVGLDKKYKGEEIDYPATLAAEKDLGNTARLIGDSIDIGAYECDTKMIQIIYVKEGSAVAGTGESWDNPTNDLQGAINLAELYANKNEGEYGYVFVNRNLKTDNVNISMPGVKMFGSMREEKSSKTEPEAIVKDLLTQRKGIIESSSQSTINRLTLNNITTGTDTRMCIVDGFKVSGNVSLQGNSMLSTSILDAKAKVSGDASGWLYNSLALGTVKDVKSVNVTASGALPSLTGSAVNRSSVTTYNKYVKDDYWKYQLDETDNANINANTDVSKTKGCIDMVMHNHDLAGNQRIRDNVDNGCFETWYLTNDTTANQDDYPHGKSVVYVMTKDKELKLDNTFYTETNPFSPGFLLLKHHAGLRGNNSYVNLTNFAVERNLKAGTNFFSMPFKATNMEVEGTNNPADGSVAAYYYNAATRAKYDYKFDQNESKAWVKGVDNQRNFTTGFRMDANGNKTVRFYGISYTEKDGRTNRSLLDKITLVQNNNQQPWSDSNGGGLKFTHKENMGWNLFGSPYLCAMNYSDMEYGRVIYQCEENGSYKAINTYDLDTGVSTAGYIPAMDAVFTQTATLDNSESVIVEHSEARAATAYQATRALDIAITQSNRNSRAGNSTPVDDQLQLNTVPAYEAKSDFDMGSDGVKWMTNQNAQIYAMRNGGRYSLLSAISIDAEQSIGVSLPETGEYTISIPEDCDASEYETVWLKDKETGKAVDLKDGCYPFYAAQTGEMNNRFNISFNRKETDMKADITIIPSGNYHILIKGLKQNDIIRIYGTSGVLALQKQAKSDTEQLRTPINGTVAVEVTRGGKQIAVKKIALK